MAASTGGADIGATLCRDVAGSCPGIAVLCWGNAQVGGLANALSQRNVTVAVERSGRLVQPAIEFMLAAFRWIADASDTRDEVPPLVQAFVRAAHLGGRDVV